MDWVVAARARATVMFHNNGNHVEFKVDVLGNLLLGPGDHHRRRVPLEQRDLVGGAVCGVRQQQCRHMKAR